jgi:lipopolysaccharide assembly protein A
MTRWLLLLLAFLVVAASVVFGAINADPVVLDLYAGSLRVPLGVLVLGAMLVGCLLGGAVLYTTVIVPLRMRLSRAKRDVARATPVVPPVE